MFGWKKKQPITRNDLAPSTASSKDGDPVIAALLMEGHSFPSGEMERAIVGRQICGQQVGSIKNDDGILSADVGDEMLFIAPMAAPYPWADLQGPVATSWMWPKERPASIVKGHRTHVLLTLIGGRSDPMSRRLMLIQITALAAKLSGVMAIYWPEATLVHYPPVFIKMAEAFNSPERPPIYLLVDFRVFKNSDGSFGLFTTGLSALGGMEVEIPTMAMAPGELRDWSTHVAMYLLEAGDKVKDGNTIGVSAEQKIRVLHRPSSFGRDRTVIRLEP